MSEQIEKLVATIDGRICRSSSDQASDPVNHPSHYRAHASGVECIKITEHFNFCLGNAIKYIWRHGEKGKALEDLQKARWYLDREISRLAELGK